MDETAMAIARKVVEDTQYFTAIVGLIGVVIGSILTILGRIALHCLRARASAKKDAPRKRLLVQMLEDDAPPHPDRWRILETLMHVIGADEETAKRLLLEVGARASEDGEPKWGLLKYHPLK